MTTWGSEQRGLGRLGVSGQEIGNYRPGATASKTSPRCNVLKSPAVGFINTGTGEGRPLGRLERQMGCRHRLTLRASYRALGLSTGPLLSSSCWHGHEKLLHIGVVPPDKSVPLFYFSLLIWMMRQWDPLIFAVSLSPRPRACGHQKSGDGAVAAAEGQKEPRGPPAPSNSDPSAAELVLRSGRLLGHSGL